MAEFAPSLHIGAQKDEIAKTVLMPGDPLRAKLIAETYLEDCKQVAGIRNMLGFTGTYKGKKLTVMGHGMGMPSMGIYSHEMFNIYDVDRIIRIGTSGGIDPDLKCRDLVIAQASCTNSNYLAQFGLPGTFAPIADFDMLKKAVEQAEKMGLTYKVGNIYSSDQFYDYSGRLKEWQKMGVLAVEMESAALYANAAYAGKKALCVATVSDCPFTGEETTAEERQNSFTNMIELALEVAVQY